MEIGQYLHVEVTSVKDHPIHGWLLGLEVRNGVETVRLVDPFPVRKGLLWVQVDRGRLRVVNALIDYVSETKGHAEAEKAYAAGAIAYEIHKALSVHRGTKTETYETVLLAICITAGLRHEEVKHLGLRVTKSLQHKIYGRSKMVLDEVKKTLDKLYEETTKETGEKMHTITEGNPHIISGEAVRYGSQGQGSYTIDFKIREMQTELSFRKRVHGLNNGVSMEVLTSIFTEAPTNEFIRREMAQGPTEVMQAFQYAENNRLWDSFPGQRQEAKIRAAVAHKYYTLVRRLEKMSAREARDPASCLSAVMLGAMLGSVETGRVVSAANHTGSPVFWEYLNRDGYGDTKLLILGITNQIANG